jgi:uncharacterized protein YegL
MPAEKVTSLNPWHIVLVLDDSGSMVGVPAQSVNEAVEGMISELQLQSQGKKPYFRLSVISFGSRSQVLEEAKSEQDISIDKVARFQGNSGMTDAAAALREATALLSRNGGTSTDFTPYVFFMSDGMPDDPRAAHAAAEVLKQLNIPAGSPRLVSVGVTGADEAFMRSIASSVELYVSCEAPQLARLFPLIGTNIGSITEGGTKAVDQMIAESAEDATDVTDI